MRSRGMHLLAIRQSHWTIHTTAALSIGPNVNNNLEAGIILSRGILYLIMIKAVLPMDI